MVRARLPQGFWATCPFARVSFWHFFLSPAQSSPFQTCAMSKSAQDSKILPPGRLQIQASASIPWCAQGDALHWCLNRHPPSPYAFPGVVGRRSKVGLVLCPSRVPLLKGKGVASCSAMPTTRPGTGLAHEEHACQGEKGDFVSTSFQTHLGFLDG